MRYTALFGAVAPEFGWVPPLRYLLRRQRILRLLGNRPHGRLLEVGCGSGALLHDFAQLGYQSEGLDSSPEALVMARAIATAGGGRQVIHGFPVSNWSTSFDLVCAFDVLEHVADDHAALDQWLSWLTAGGQLCISVPAHSKRWGAGDEWAGHFRRYDRQSLLQLLANKQLVIEHIECYGFPLANLTEALGNRTYRRLMRERGEQLKRAEATTLSGVDRREYSRLFALIDTLPGRMALRTAMVTQAVTSKVDLGSGYLVLARRA